MSRLRGLTLGVPNYGGGGLLPVDIDFSTLSDGALPSPLLGDTWSVSSGVAVNVPALGSELLTDPGLEANYTAGKCDTLSVSGSPTLTESADVHGGSKAQQFEGAALGNAVTWPLAAGAAGQWYQYSMWAKRTAGTADNVQVYVYQAGAQPTEDNFNVITSASYAQVVLSFISTAANNLFRHAARFGASSGSDTVIVDDGSFKAITYQSLFALLPATQSDIVIKVQPDTLTDSTLHGIVLRADAQSAPTNCVFVMASQSQIATIQKISVVKKVGSTYTRVLNETLKTKVADAWLEVRSSGDTVQVFYNNAQVGADLTISDAELVSNKYHGSFSAGGNSLKGFFVQAN